MAHSVLIVSLICAFVLLWANKQVRLPVLSILNRWVRWGLFSLTFGVVSQEFGWFPGKPLGVLIAVAFLIWFFLETGYTWLAIKALSRSSVSLFPFYTVNVSGFKWPVMRQFIDLKNEIQALGYKEAMALKATVIEGVDVQVLVYENGVRDRRLLVLFVPRRDGDFSVHYVISSVGQKNTRVVTDNIGVPYGGYYPETWDVTRRPLTRSLSGLNSLHEKRLVKLDFKAIQLDEAVLRDLNEEQRELLLLNTRKGFVFPAHLVEEFGRITKEGRYRIWMEIWLMNYFGFALKG